MNLTENYRLTALKHVKKIPTGLDAFLLGMYGKLKGRRTVLWKILRMARKIDCIGIPFREYTDAHLQSEIHKVSDLFKRKVDDETLQNAFALVCEVVFRKMGFRPYVEQIAGALALYRGYIAELSTGEGKTVTAVICATVRGWSGRPCHVITANDYLANRDAETMRPIYNFCGVSVGCVTGAMKPPERKEGYAADVTYSTAKEVLADFLRDNIALGTYRNFSKRVLSGITENVEKVMSRTVQRGIYTAIVDEADNVLIDEAVTPLIISREKDNEAFNSICKLAYGLALQLEKGKDYALDEKNRMVRFLVDMDDRLEELQNKGITDKVPGEGESQKNVFCKAAFLKDLVRQALIALNFFINGRQYVVEEGKVIIVDESTGRKMPMRSWNGGLHQMIEIKEGVEITGLKETEARMSFQRFFRLYKNFSGMTGTAKEAAREFWTIYGAPVLCIPNHRKNIRKVSVLKSYSTKEAKRNAIVREIVRLHKQGRPILVGTKDIDDSEIIGEKIAQMGLECRIINAVRSEEEAAVIAAAGKYAAITVATNMAGRGTDIKIEDRVRELGGLHVIATECNPSARIDRQLFGRSARQGDPGSASHYASFEDDVLKRNLPPTLMPLFKHLGALSALVVKFAQFVAGRKAYQNRLAVQRMDTWLEDSLGFSSGEI